MMSALRALETTFRRELATVVRTPGYAVLGLGVLFVVAGVTLVGGGGSTGLLPAIVDLLLPVEVLVPLVAVVLGYRALLTDAASGELAVIRTYPVGVVAYALGILLARLVALVALVGLPLALIGGYVWVTAAPETGIYATHSGVDSPWLFVRFLVFTFTLGASYLAVAAAVSSLAAGRRSALALGGVVLVGGVLGGDLAVLRSLSGDGATTALAGTVASTPNGAFRGLVFEYVVGVAFEAGDGFVDPGRAVATLLGWCVAGVGVAVGSLAYGRRVDALFERVLTRLRG